MIVFNKDVCVLASGASRFEQRRFSIRCDFDGRVSCRRFALCDCRGLFKVIRFVALSKVCEMAAMTICVWVLATPKYCADAIQTFALLYQAPFDAKALLADQLLNALLRWA